MGNSRLHFQNADYGMLITMKFHMALNHLSIDIIIVLQFYLGKSNPPYTLQNTQSLDSPHLHTQNNRYQYTSPASITPLTLTNIESWQIDLGSAISSYLVPAKSDCYSGLDVPNGFLETQATDSSSSTYFLLKRFINLQRIN